MSHGKLSDRFSRAVASSLWFGAENQSGRFVPSAGNQRGVPAERRGQTQADGILRSEDVPPDRPGDAARRADINAGDVEEAKGIEPEPNEPAEWQSGWEKRGGIVAACVVGFIVLFIWAGGSKAPSGPPPITIGDMVEVRQGFFGCQLKSDIKQVQVLAFERHDASAASVYRQTHDCPVFEKGAVVEVSDMAGFSGLYCLRWRGNPDCYWFPEKFVGRRRSSNPVGTSTKAP